MTTAGSFLIVDSDHWLGLLRLHRIIVDDVEVARIGRRQQARVELTPGHHMVAVGFGQQQSRPLEVDVAAGDTARVRIEYDIAGLMENPKPRFAANMQRGAILRRVA